MKPFDVVGIGNPLLDFTVHVDEKQLEELALPKSGMTLIEKELSVKIFRILENHDITISPGGSSANTMAGVALFGGKASLFGKIGNDDFGQMFEQKTVESGVISHLAKHESSTGHAITLITPDGERTFGVHLGAAIHLSEEDIDEQPIKQSKILHLEGFQLEGPNLKAAMKGIGIAKEHGVKISIDFSDAGLIGRNLEAFQELLKEHVDIVFVNEDEAKALTGKEEKEALEELYAHTEIAVVKLGARGSLIKKDDTLIEIAPVETKVENENGAGDMFAAAFLYGLTQEWPLEKAGRLASRAASAVVASPGARIGSDEKDMILKAFEEENKGE